MPLPIVAIVGRPNVGKSSLFNALVGTRASIVEATPGVTRDRLTSVCDIDEVYFELVDTGGYGIVDRDDLGEHVERQIQYAIDQADLILFVVDAREDVNPLDRAMAELLRVHTDSVRLLANKVDAEHFESQLGEYVKLGFGHPLGVSAVTGYGRSDLRDLILSQLPSTNEKAPGDPVIKIAIVGKRNAGKSTFINALAGGDRVIVSEIPGTTRDSVDVRFEKDGRTLLAIDTAGVRKKRKLRDDVEYYALNRALRSIHRADVILFLIDATVPVGQVDKHLGRVICDELKPCVLVVNKWDLAKGRASTEEFGEYLGKMLVHLRYAPIAFTSATQDRNVAGVIDLSTAMFKQARTRIGTGRLNKALREATEEHPPKAKRGRRPPKLLYATQVSTQPPTIVVFVNGAHLVTQAYQRYLLNQMRDRLPFEEVPIRLLFRSRRSQG